MSLFTPAAIIQRKLRTAVRLYKAGGLRALKAKIFKTDLYPEWVNLHDTLSDEDRYLIAQHCDRFAARPLFSILVPTYNTPENVLRSTIESVRRQIYPHWELCIADDNSPSPVVAKVLNEYAALDPRIKYTARSSNGHIAEATNSAADLATGDFIAFLDHDDELREHALYLMALEINEHPDLEIIYSDEDKMTPRGTRHFPHFKYDWNPEALLHHNYVCHLTVIKRQLFERVGRVRSGFDGAQDWELILRASEHVPASTIRHVPHILYHWRTIPGSTAGHAAAKPYVTQAQIKAVKEHLSRTESSDVRVEQCPITTLLRVHHPIQAPAPLVSLIIPTFNQKNLLQTCVCGILSKTAYKNIELVIVDNRSDDPETLKYLSHLASDPRIKIIRDEGPFNFSRLNNRAVSHASGSVLAFVNNDIEVLDDGWLTEMVSHVLRPQIGAVGARLLYPNKTVQHAGVTLGIGGVADHIFKFSPCEEYGYFCRTMLPHNVSAVTAACMLMRKDFFLQLGGFDEQELAVAYNDVDLCLRIRATGKLIVYTPYAELIHHESISRGYEDSPEKQARFLKEFNTMLHRWGPALANDPYYNPNLAINSHVCDLAFPPRHPKPWKRTPLD